MYFHLFKAGHIVSPSRAGALRKEERQNAPWG